MTPLKKIQIYKIKDEKLIVENKNQTLRMSETAYLKEEHFKKTI